MITDKDIARINELYHKSKNEGLSPEEKDEQARLRENISHLSAKISGQIWII